MSEPVYATIDTVIENSFPDSSQRPITISHSIIQSCKEVTAMREGKIPKRSLDELFSNIEKWVTEEK